MERQIDRKTKVCFYGNSCFQGEFTVFARQIDLRHYLDSAEKYLALNLSMEGTRGSHGDLTVFKPNHIEGYWKVRDAANRGDITLLLGGEPGLVYDPEKFSKMLEDYYYNSFFEKRGIKEPTLESIGFPIQIPSYGESVFMYEVEGLGQTSQVYGSQENKDLMHLLLSENFLDALVLRDENAIRESIAEVNEQHAGGRIIVSECLSEVLNS
jgi:hypothetical protein